LKSLKNKALIYTLPGKSCIKRTIVKLSIVTILRANFCMRLDLNSTE